MSTSAINPTTRVHGRCGTPITRDSQHISSDDYYAACLACDEDLFALETVTRQEFEAAEAEYNKIIHDLNTNPETC